MNFSELKLLLESVDAANEPAIRSGMHLHSDPEVRASYAKTTDNEDHLEMLSKDSNYKVRKAVASNIDAVHVHDDMVQDKSYLVRLQLARTALNSAGDPYVAGNLIEDPHPVVKRTARRAWNAAKYRGEV